MKLSPIACPAFLLSIALVACSSPHVPADARDTAVDAIADGVADAPADAPRDAAPMCHADTDCTNHVFCDGEERCMPGASGANAVGCAAASAPACLSGQTCNESMARCESACTTAPDADGDGHRAIACGGDDCDDSDPNRFPGNTEVCDTSNHDEDCDPATFGFRDGDGDSYPDQRCCNVDPSGTRICGTDCNDNAPNVHPTLVETCDGIDNNCNGMTDEGVLRSFWPDADGDGFGASTGTPMMLCTPPPGTAENHTDCDDTMAAVHPGAVEVCGDGIDNDCDGHTDDMGMLTVYRDADGDGWGDATTASVQTSCTVPPGFVTRPGDCRDSNATVYPMATELCDRIDNNCSLPGTFAGGVDTTEDADTDGFAPIGAMCVGGPFPATDCDDTLSVTHPGASEICDGRDNNCNGTIDEGDPGGGGTCYVTPCQPGLFHCMSGTLNCVAGPPPVEVCNGVDDNCNGIVDDVVGTGTACSTGMLGVCVAGVNRCVGTSVQCVRTTAPSTETCNGRDDNCDGTVDNGAPCPSGRTCRSGACM